jgi:acetyl esterase
VLGNLDDYDAFCRDFAYHSACQIASVGYRLAPENPFPTALHDTVAAIEWLADRASALSIDLGRLGLAGDSAGANLVAVARQSFATPALRHIRKVALFYPGTDFTMGSASHLELASGYMLTRDVLQWFLAQYLQQGELVTDPRVSPLFGPAAPGLQHALVITAAFDPLRDEGHSFAGKLRMEGVSVDLHCFDDMIHGFMTMGGIFESSHAAVRLAGHWFARQLA